MEPVVQAGSSVSYTIGRLAREVRCGVQTIRYYEQVGLLPAAHRTEGKQRRFDKTHLDRLHFIRHGRDLGFSLESIRELLNLADAPRAPCDDADRIARRQLEDVLQRIERLTALRAELERMIEQCRGGHIESCRVIEALSNHKLCAGHESGDTRIR